MRLPTIDESKVFLDNTQEMFSQKTSSALNSVKQFILNVQGEFFVSKLTINSHTYSKNSLINRAIKSTVKGLTIFLIASSILLDKLLNSIRSARGALLPTKDIVLTYGQLEENMRRNGQLQPGSLVV